MVVGVVCGHHGTTLNASRGKLTSLTTARMIVLSAKVEETGGHAALSIDRKVHEI